MKDIIWKTNSTGGKNAYVGKIKIGIYFYNSIDSKNGVFKVSSLMPQSLLINEKVMTTIEAERLIVSEFDKFINEITK